jgi:anti-anti-sigma factor
VGSNVIRFPVCQPDTHPDHEPAEERVVRLVVTRRLSRSGSDLVVRVTGDVDLATAATLAGAFDRACRGFREVPGGLGIVADLRAVSFLSAAGMRVLVGVRDACLAEGLDLRVVATHAAVVAPLASAGLDRMLNLQAELPC